MLVPVGMLNPGDEFVELDSDPRLDLYFTVLDKDCFGDIIAEDQFGYKNSFEPTKIVRICR